MITLSHPVAYRVGFLILSLVVGSAANAQSGVTFQLDEVREQLARIDAGVSSVGNTIDEIAFVERSRCDRPVSWNRKFPGNERFVPALNGHAFCDVETGLVWEEAPDPDPTYWRSALVHCANLEIDGRMGWHLPTIEELQSLIEGYSPDAGLPVGHPFLGLSEINTESFFSSSPGQRAVYGHYPTIWFIYTDGGPPIEQEIGVPPFTSAQKRAWCVRGGANVQPIINVNLEGDEIEPFPN